MNALVTGAAGFIGSHLVERLLDNGARVTGIDCFTDFYARSIKEANVSPLRARSQFQLVDSRIEDADLARLLREVTHVFHLAAQAGVRESWGRDFRVYTASNVDATQILLEACVGIACERFVYASSSSVYGDDAALPMRETARPQPVSPYGVTKLAAEHLCHLYHVNHGVPAVSLRYFTVYGPRQRPDMAFHRFLKAALSDAPIGVYGDGRQTRDFTYVADAVAATVAAATRGVPGRVYNVGGGSSVSVNRVLVLIARCTGRPLTLRRQPPQKGDMRDTYADTHLAQSELDFTPKVSLDEGIESEHQWLSTAGALV